MSLMKRNNGGLLPFRNLLTDFFNADDLTFDRLWNREWSMPAVNIAETDKTFELELAAPGMRKNDFKVKIENGMLNISAEREEEKKENQKNYTRREYSYNSFNRSFTLPENVKEEDIKAHYEDGVLKLTLAKKVVTVSKAKEIAVI